MSEQGTVTTPPEIPGWRHIYSGKVAVYNPKIVTTAPTSYKDVFDPKGLLNPGKIFTL